MKNIKDSTREDGLRGFKIYLNEVLKEEKRDKEAKKITGENVQKFTEPIHRLEPTKSQGIRMDSSKETNPKTHGSTSTKTQ